MLKKYKNLTEVNLDKNIVAVRANLDVEIVNGEIVDDTKIKAILPTLQLLIKQNCKIILLTHLGEAKGEYNDDYSTMPIRFVIGNQLQKPTKFVNINNCDNSIKFMEFGDILVLENLFFSPEEFSTDKKVRNEFIKKIAQFVDYYVNETFGIEEELASISELPKLVTPLNGLHYAKEIENIEKLKGELQSPVVSIFGGNITEEKLETMEFFAKKSDTMLIGGALAYNFLHQKKVDIGESKFQKGFQKKIDEITKIAKENNCEIILPIDHIASKTFDENAQPIEVQTQNIKKGLMGMDIGPKTLVMFRETIEAGKTLFWTGPIGVFEWENFNKGTEAIGEFLALSTPKDAYKIVCGEDTIKALNHLKIKHKRFNHVSIGARDFLRELR